MDELFQTLNVRLFMNPTTLKEYNVTVMLTNGNCHTYTINKTNVGKYTRDGGFSGLFTFLEKPGEYISIPFARITEVAWKEEN